MMNKDQRLRNIFYLLLSIIVAAVSGIMLDESSGESCFRRYGIFPIEYTESWP